jgi:hypothetical protein
LSEARHIRFEPEGRSESGKTQIWKVVTKDSNVLLGYVRWYAPWRCYSFFVWSKDDEFDLVFEKTCLRDIGGFCENQTLSQRTGRFEQE